MTNKPNDVSEVVQLVEYYLDQFNNYWNESGMFLDHTLDYDDECNDYLDEMLFEELQRDQPELHKAYLHWCRN